MSASKFAESGNIDKLVIHAHGGTKSIDISGGLATLMYFESVLENCVHASLVIADTGYGDAKLNNLGILAGLPLRGGEKVFLKFTDSYGNQIAFDNNTKPLYVDKIRDKYTDGTKTIFTLDLITREFLYNEYYENRALNKYSGKISDTVTRILRDSLKTKKNIDVEETLNSEVVYGNTVRPLELCTVLATHGIPSDVKGARGKLAGYFFYETKDGFYFKSIDNLLTTDKVVSLYKYIYNSSGKTPPTGYVGNILDYSEDFYVSLQEQMRKGTWGFKTETINLFPEEEVPLNEVELTADDQEKVAVLASKTSYPDFGEFSNVITERSFSIKDVGINVNGYNVDDQLDESREENFVTAEIISQSKMRYNQLFTIKIDITVPGNFALFAGRLIECDFKSTTANNNANKDLRLSGIYMIADLCHLVTPKETYTRLTLVRESYGGSNP